MRNAWIGTSGDWSDGMKWQRGLPQPGDTAVLGNGASVSLAATPIGLAGLKIDDGAQLAVTGWDTCVTAGVVTVDGTLTTPAALDAGDASGANNPASRLWVRCASLTVGATGRIDVNAKGWMAGYAAPGSPKEGAGASHGGYGSITRVSTKLGAIYDDPLAPTYPGSGYYTTDGTAGGGAVRIEAAGAVTVNGKLLASGGDVPVNASSCSWKYAGSGGSIWISCATFAGSGGEVRADGGVPRCGRRCGRLW